jgi:hypothetical protein
VGNRRRARARGERWWCGFVSATDGRLEGMLFLAAAGWGPGFQQVQDGDRDGAADAGDEQEGVAEGKEKVGQRR